MKSLKKSLKIENCKLKIPQRGFTLIELLVVITVLAIMGTILTEVFVRTLRANTKSKVLAAVKQNGQVALETMDKTIRNSLKVECPINNGYSNTLVLLTLDETTNLQKYVRFVYNPNPSGNGYITQDTSYDPSTSSCAAGAPLGAQSVTSNKNLQSDVSVISSDPGIFYKDSLGSYNDQVSVHFKVGPAKEVPTAATGLIDPVDFKTSVTLRLN